MNAMSLPEAFLLGLIQGVTEFLPVSSSGHLVIAQHLLGWREPLLLFDVVVHLGTLASLTVYFAKDLAHLIRDSLYGIFNLFGRKSLQEIFASAPYFRWTLGIALASIPIALVGLSFVEEVEALFGSLRVTGLALLGTSLLLWLTRYFSLCLKGMDAMRPFDFLAVGLFQALAVIPGLSRSGATISGGLFCKLDRETAFRFSFLLAFPALLGAGIFEFGRAGADGGAGFPSLLGEAASPLLIGFLTAALSGYLALLLLAKIVRQGKLHRFAFYTLPLGLLTLALSFGLE